MSTSPPTVSKSSRFNIGQFIIDGLFIKFYSNNNMEKVLKKNGINDKIIKCSLMQIVDGSENTDTLVAWLDCSNNDYFLVCDKCRNSVERFKKCL